MNPAPRPSASPHSRWAPWLFIAPFLLLFTLFTLWPLIQSLLLAFQQTFGPKSSTYVGTGNFTFLLQDPMFWKAVRNTALYTLGAVLIQLPIALGLALLLNRPQLKARAVFRLIFFAPSLVGMVFVGIMFAQLFQKRTGFIQMAVTSERGSEVVERVEICRIELNRALPGGHRRVGLSGLEGNDAQSGVRL